MYSLVSVCKAFQYCICAGGPPLWSDADFNTTMKQEKSIAMAEPAAKSSDKARWINQQKIFF